MAWPTGRAHLVGTARSMRRRHDRTESGAKPEPCSRNRKASRQGREGRKGMRFLMARVMPPNGASLHGKKNCVRSFLCALRGLGVRLQLHRSGLVGVRRRRAHELRNSGSTRKRGWRTTENTEDTEEEKVGAQGSRLGIIQPLNLRPMLFPCVPCLPWLLLRNSGSTLPCRRCLHMERLRREGELDGLAVERLLHLQVQRL